MFFTTHRNYYNLTASQMFEVEQSVHHAQVMNFLLQSFLMSLAKGFDSGLRCSNRPLVKK